MKIPKSLTTVTPLSKMLALFLFILLPFVGFYFGMGYQSKVDLNNQSGYSDTSLNSLNPSEIPQEHSNTINWKTYINNDLGVSGLYPNDWRISSPFSLESFINIGSRKNVRVTINFNRYGVTSLPKGYTSVFEWFKDLKNKNQKSMLPNDGFYYGAGGDTPYRFYMYYNMDNFKNVVVNNISSIITSNASTGLLYLVIPTTNYIYEIGIDPISAYGNPTIDKIISTLKFTN